MPVTIDRAERRIASVDRRKLVEPAFPSISIVPKGDTDTRNGKNIVSNS
jgi:hypothetical protein